MEWTRKKLVRTVHLRGFLFLCGYRSSTKWLLPVPPLRAVLLLPSVSPWQVSEAELTEKEIDESRERYRPVAYRGSIMYFCIRDFNVVDPMYQYSLQWFTNLFVQVRKGAT